MEKLNFSIKIEAPREKVWNTLWEDKTFRDWANNIDKGMYLEGVIEEGAEVRFCSAKAEYVVMSLIEKLIPNEFVSFRHRADNQEGQEQENEWTGGQESFSLTERDGVTTLTMELDTPPEQVENFKERLPKALEQVKILAEKKE